MAKKSDKYNDEGGFGTFLYNSNTGQVLGRTCGSWIKITIFYIIFYACLSAFFYVCYQIFATTLQLPEDNNGSPKWVQDASLIGSNPGVGFRPTPDRETNSDSTLIWYKTTTKDDSRFWSSQLDQFLNETTVAEGKDADNVISCGYGGSKTSAERVCRVPTDNLGECKSDNEFGYPEGKPCVLIKLNKIYGWEPEPYGMIGDKYDAARLEEELSELVRGESSDRDNGMPEELKTHIINEVKNNPDQAVDILKTVWISCVGENVGDRENLPNSKVIYKPHRGIPGYYFPYLNQKNYKSPFLMLKLDVPATSRHTLINIECRAWAKNIHYERQNRLGSVHFEILVD